MTATQHSTGRTRIRRLVMSRRRTWIATITRRTFCHPPTVSSSTKTAGRTRRPSVWSATRNTCVLSGSYSESLSRLGALTHELFAFVVSHSPVSVCSVFKHLPLLARFVHAAVGPADCAAGMVNRLIRYIFRATLVCSRLADPQFLDSLTTLPSLRHKCSKRRT